MAAVSRSWLREVAQPTDRIRRTALGAVRRTRTRAKLLGESISAARSASERHLREAERVLRTSVLPEAGARLKRTGARAPKGILLLFLGSLVTGAVFGLSGSLAQTLTTALCALTLSLSFSLREAQQREALALRRSLDELRASLRVTHALLEASELQGAEELRNSKLPPVSVEEREDDETRRISLCAVVVS